MKILFITSTRVGDCVLSTGLLSSLLQRYPQARFTIACGAVGKDVFANMPQLERIIVVNKRCANLHWLSLWWQCVTTAWDIVIDLRRSGLGWALLSKKRARLPYQRKGDATPRVAHIASILGLQEDPPSPCLWPLASQWKSQQKALKNNKPIIVVAPIANWEPKQWPWEHYKKLLLMLTSTDGPLAQAHIAICAAEHERRQSAAQALLHDPDLPPRLDWIGYDLPLVAASLPHADLFVGNDSGLMHMAAASNIPTIGLFGPTSVTHYAPWGEHAQAVTTPDSSPHMQELAPQTVFQAAVRVVKTSGKKQALKP